MKKRFRIFYLQVSLTTILLMYFFTYQLDEILFEVFNYVLFISFIVALAFLILHWLIDHKSFFSKKKKKKKRNGYKPDFLD